MNKFIKALMVNFILVGVIIGFAFANTYAASEVPFTPYKYGEPPFKNDSLGLLGLPASTFEITSPPPESTLKCSSSVTFTWTKGADDYGLEIYNDPDYYDLLYGTDPLGKNTTSHTVPGSEIPQDGRTLYVVLWYKVNGKWEPQDYTYTAPDEDDCNGGGIAVGKRVVLQKDNPDGASSLPKGTKGKVICGCGNKVWLVSWDSWTKGHSNSTPCDTTPESFPPNSGWWVREDEISLDTTSGGGSCDYAVGQKVTLQVNNPNGAKSLPKGTKGTIICKDEEVKGLWLVSWDGWTGRGGDNDPRYCLTPPSSSFTPNSQYWVYEDQILVDCESGGSSHGGGGHNGGQPNPGDPCETDEGEEGIVDCSGKCVSADIVNDWKGDGYCDDEDSEINLNCDAFNNDDEDCDGSIIIEPPDIPDLPDIPGLPPIPENGRPL